MPIYVYEVVHEDGESGHRFEYRQRMEDPPLTHHPTTGEPVRRVLQPPHIGGKHSDASEKRKLADNRRLGELGFTKYTREDDGSYKKRAGKGPDVLSPQE